MSALRKNRGVYIEVTPFAFPEINDFGWFWWVNVNGVTACGETRTYFGGILAAWRRGRILRKTVMA